MSDRRNTLYAKICAEYLENLDELDPNSDEYQKLCEKLMHYEYNPDYTSYFTGEKIDTLEDQLLDLVMGYGTDEWPEQRYRGYDQKTMYAEPAWRKDLEDYLKRYEVILNREIKLTNADPEEFRTTKEEKEYVLEILKSHKYNPNYISIADRQTILPMMEDQITDLLRGYVDYNKWIDQSHPMFENHPMYNKNVDMKISSSKRRCVRKPSPKRRCVRKPSSKRRCVRRSSSKRRRKPSPKRKRKPSPKRKRRSSPKC